MLPYGRQSIDDDDIQAVVQVLRGDWLTQGPAIGRFETAFAQAVGVQHAIACANGTAALHLAMLALDLQPGDAVVVPSVTFLASANVVRLAGAEVAFADVDPDTGLIRPDDAQAALDRAKAAGWRPRALLPVHLAGQVADVAEMAQAHGLDVVEDACHAVGTRSPDGAPVGACATSRMACFSFHPVKTIATGEGGMITTNDATVAARLRRLLCHGMSRDPARFQSSADIGNPWYYEMDEPGLNYRLTDLQAALGCSQLGKLSGFVARRAELVARYDRGLASLGNRIRPAGRVAGCRPGWHLYVVLLDFDQIGQTRRQVVERLRAQDIGTQVHYIPVHTQPYYRRRYPGLDLPGAEGWYQRCLSLPLFPAMTDADVDRVVDALADIIR